MRHRASVCLCIVTYRCVSYVSVYFVCYGPCDGGCKNISGLRKYVWFIMFIILGVDIWDHNATWCKF